MESHNHLILATSLETAPIPDELKTEGPDVRHILIEKLGIGDARLLTEQSSRRALNGKTHNFVIVTNNITLEAQNALLKLFEEPPANTVFFLIIPHESLLLPTLRSRFVDQIRATEKTSTEADEFLTMSLGERMEYITKQAKKDPSSLERLATDLGRKKNLTPEAKRSLLLVNKYVYNRGASRKALLEELALSL